MAAWHLFTVAASGGLCEGEQLQEVVGGNIRRSYQTAPIGAVSNGLPDDAAADVQPIGGVDLGPCVNWRKVGSRTLCSRASHTGHGGRNMSA
jgi:hypothetical protein